MGVQRPDVCRGTPLEVLNGRPGGLVTRLDMNPGKLGVYEVSLTGPTFLVTKSVVSHNLGTRTGGFSKTEGSGDITPPIRVSENFTEMRENR